MKLKISEDVVLPVEIIVEDSDSRVSLSDVLGVTASTISWIANLLAFRDLLSPVAPAPPPGPPLPPTEQIKLLNDNEIDLNLTDNNLVIYLLLTLLFLLSTNNNQV